MKAMDLDDVNKKQDTVVKEMLKIGYAVNKWTQPLLI